MRMKNTQKRGEGPGQCVPNATHENCAEKIFKWKQRISHFQKNGTELEIDEEEEQALESKAKILIEP